MKKAKPITIEESEPEVSGSAIARRFDVDPATIRRWRREGMPHIVYGQKMIRYKVAEVSAWLKVRGAQPRPAIIPPHERKKKEAATK